MISISNVRRQHFAPPAAGLLLACALVLPGCASNFDILPEKIGGLPANAPERPVEAKAFPNVYEVRPTREAKPLTDAEQKKLESELATLREAQKQRANPPPPPPPPKAAAAAGKKAPTKTAAPTKKKQDDSVVPEQKGPVAPPKMVN